MTTEYFTLKEDGVIGWIENMPPKPREQYPQLCTMAEITEYQQALQSAIDSAVEVSNQEEVRSALAFTFGVDYPNHVNRPYPLQCHVEKKQISTSRAISVFPGKTVALVTFSEPEEKGKVENYICLNCKVVTNYEPNECWCCGRKSFHKTEAEADLSLPTPSSGVEETQEELMSKVEKDVEDCIGTYSNTLTKGIASLITRRLFKYYTINRKNK